MTSAAMPMPLGRRPSLMGVLAALTIGAMLAALALGAYALSPPAVISALLEPLGIGLGAHTPEQAFVLLHIRLPRVVLAALVGGALGISGALSQGLFRNPLAEPALIGVASGAAVGAAIVLVFGATLLAGAPDILRQAALPLAAFTGGGLATLLVRRLARVEGRTAIDIMLLAGVALNALGFAAIGLLQVVADDEQLRSLTFWMLGSLGGATWSALAVAAPPMLLVLLLGPLLAGPLDALLLGEREAGHMGIDVQRLERRCVALVALAVGAAVALCGVIGFVGLVVPHLARKLGSVAHRSVLPASILIGAGLLVIADTLARTLTAPAELPIGAITSLAGAPFFLMLLRRRR